MDSEAVREHFRVQVADYPDLMRRLVPFYDEQREIIVALIPFQRHQSIRVLDLGCGPGLLARRMLSEFPYAELTAFDLTGEMLQACRARLADTDRVTYRLGDFRTDDLGRGYNLIVASLALHHLQLSERPEFYRRAYEALTDGGLLIGAEVINDESPAVRERQYQLWREFMVQNGEDGDQWYRKHLEKDHPASVSSLLALLAGACFEAPGCFWRYLNFAILSARKPAV